MSSDDAGALVHQALRLSHQAADDAVDAIRTAERGLESARMIPDGAVQAAAQAALKSARHGRRVAHDAIAVADRTYQSVIELPESALEGAQEALKLAIYARKLMRHVGEESEAVQAALEAWDADGR